MSVGLLSCPQTGVGGDIMALGAMNWQVDGISLAGGYLLGSIPFGLIFAWLAGAGDVRSIGSGSIGATNVLRTGKYWAAAATAVIRCSQRRSRGVDRRQVLWRFRRGVRGARRVSRPSLSDLAGLQGCKGIAVALGVTLALAWPAALAMLRDLDRLSAAISRISSLSALITAVMAPVYMYFLSSTLNTLLTIVLAVLVCIVHRANVARLLNGTEPRIGAKKAP